VRGFGVREIAAGIGILAAPERSAGLWARAAGDVLDIGAAGLGAARTEKRARAIVLGSLAFVALRSQKPYQIGWFRIGAGH
jgi:hypothetical protein